MCRALEQWIRDKYERKRFMKRGESYSRPQEDRQERQERIERIPADRGYSNNTHNNNFSVRDNNPAPARTVAPPKPVTAAPIKALPQVSAPAPVSAPPGTFLVYIYNVWCLIILSF